MYFRVYAALGNHTRHIGSSFINGSASPSVQGGAANQFCHGVLCSQILELRTMSPPQTSFEEIPDTQETLCFALSNGIHVEETLSGMIMSQE